MTQQHVFQVTFKPEGGMIMTRSVNAENMWQAREKIKQSYARSGVKIISCVKIR